MLQNAHFSFAMENATDDARIAESINYAILHVVYSHKLFKTISFRNT
ncbi:hypothetical protein [Mycoplasmopsis bovis]